MFIIARCANNEVCGTDTATSGHSSCVLTKVTHYLQDPAQITCEIARSRSGAVKPSASHRVRSALCRAVLKAARPNLGPVLFRFTWSALQLRLIVARAELFEVQIQCGLLCLDSVLLQVEHGHCSCQLGLGRTFVLVLNTVLFARPS